MLGCIQPMSSPMMNRMLGFCCCCAAAGVLAAVTAANSASKPSHTFRDKLIVRSSKVINWLVYADGALAPSSMRIHALGLRMQRTTCLRLPWFVSLHDTVLAARVESTACARKHCANSFTDPERLKLHKGEGRGVPECGVQHHASIAHAAGASTRMARHHAPPPS